MRAAAASWSGWTAARPRLAVAGRRRWPRGRAARRTRTDQPPCGGRAGEAAAVGVVVGQQQRAAVALGERAVLDQLERLVGQVQQAQEVRDRDAAAPDAAADLLARETQLLDQAAHGARLLDRVEVLARHVLDQRDLERRASSRVLDERRASSRGPRAARRASGARRRRARRSRPGAGGRARAAGRRARCSESASACSASSSKRLRGWSGLGAIEVDGELAQLGRRRASSPSDTDRIAASPRPMPRRSATGGHLLGELEVGLRTAECGS